MSVSHAYLSRCGRSVLSQETMMGTMFLCGLIVGVFAGWIACGLWEAH